MSSRSRTRSYSYFSHWEKHRDDSGKEKPQVDPDFQLSGGGRLPEPEKRGWGGEWEQNVWFLTLHFWTSTINDLYGHSPTIHRDKFIRRVPQAEISHLCPILYSPLIFLYILFASWSAHSYSLLWVFCWRQPDFSPTGSNLIRSHYVFILTPHTWELFRQITGCH